MLNKVIGHTVVHSEVVYSQEVASMFISGLKVTQHKLITQAKVLYTVQQIIQSTKQLLSSLTKNIPITISSIEKQKFIGDEIIRKMPEPHKVLLRKLMNGFLSCMREVDASDIDLGGWAAKKMVWLRIHGSKKPVPKLGVYEMDELNILIQSLLMEGQRTCLYENRNF